MLRAVCLTAALAATTATGFAQPRPPAADCRDRIYTDRNRASHCETREETFAGSGLLDVDGSPNGGIRVHGWDRTDIHLVAQIIGGRGQRRAGARHRRCRPHRDRRPGARKRTGQQRPQRMVDGELPDRCAPRRAPGADDAKRRHLDRGLPRRGDLPRDQRRRRR